MARLYSDFIEYIKTDLDAREQPLSVIKFFTDPITRFHWYLRVLEYLQDKPFFFPFFIFVKIFFLNLSRHLGFSIPINTLGKGVYIPHWGTIVVNSKAEIGDFTVLNVDVVIGRHPTSKDKVPVVGRGVYIAPGAKLYGDIKVGDNCVIGANSVVSMDIPDRYIAVGVPAKPLQPLTEQSYSEFGIKVGFEKDEN